MTNEEYRKTLKVKNSGLSELKRELENLKALHSSKQKELEFSLT